MKFAGGRGVRRGGGGLHQPSPVPDLRMDWKAAGKVP